MGTECGTWGINEQETNAITLQWTAGWAKQLARAFAATVEAVRRIGCGPMDTNYDSLTREELINKLDAVNIVASGIAETVANQYSVDDPWAKSPCNNLCRLSKEFDDVYKQASGNKPVPICFNRHAFEFADIDDFKDNSRVVVYIDGNSNYLRMAKGHQGEFFHYILDRVNESATGNMNDAKVTLVFADKKCVERVYNEYYESGTKTTIFQKLRDKFADLRMYYWETKLMSDTEYLAEMKAKEEKETAYADTPNMKPCSNERAPSIEFNCPPVDDPLSVQPISTGIASNLLEDIS